MLNSNKIMKKNKHEIVVIFKRKKNNYRDIFLEFSGYLQPSSSKPGPRDITTKLRPRFFDSDNCYNHISMNRTRTLKPIGGGFSSFRVTLLAPTLPLGEFKQRA